MGMCFGMMMNTFVGNMFQQVSVLREYSNVSYFLAEGRRGLWW